MPPSNEPDERDERAATEAALACLADAGADLTRPMELEFFVVAPSEAIARVIAVRTTGMGFVTRVEEDPEAGEWLCGCRVTLVPELERVLALGRLLDRLAGELGAFLDGFGSPGNALAE